MATTLRARYVFPLAGDPIPDGFVHIEGDRIVACGAGVPPASEELHDFGNAAILPGLVNAHAHLDFSDLVTPLGHRGMRLVDWIRKVMEFRCRPSPDRQPTALGLEESLRGGVTAIGDIVQPHQPPMVSPAEVTAFLELIAPTADRVAGALELAASWLAGAASVPVGRQECLSHRGEVSVPLLGTSSAIPIEPASHCLYQAVTHHGSQLGLSPHAPYSVHPELLAAVIELSGRHKILVAMHLAESPEELELLRNGDGPMRTFLEEIGAWDATAHPPTARPLDYLRQLAVAYRALVVHGNYLDDEEIAFLGDHSAQMSVVYCPRTHDWFMHRTYPLEKMRAAGATIALGTDGRGSSPDLSMLSEMQFVARHYPSIPLADIVRMATIDGARALGREADFGSLVSGKLANLAVVALPNCPAADPHELLFDPSATVVACYCRGIQAALAYRSGNAATS
jgi:aminodeoxyfutalosine deaminase